MNLTCIILGVLFLVIGFLFSIGKLHNKIEAYKRMPSEEKAKININALVRNIGEVIMLSGLIFVAYGSIPSFKNHWFIIAMVAWLIVAFIDLIYIEKSTRFQNKRE